MTTPETIVTTIYVLSTIIWIWIWKWSPTIPRYNISVEDIILYPLILLLGFIPLFNTVAAIGIIFDKLVELKFNEWLTKPRFNKR